MPAVGGLTALEAAWSFVLRRELGANLKGLALAAALRTQTYAGLVSRIGEAEARSRVSNELASALVKYQYRWNQNLAYVYAKHFTADELVSLTAQGNESPYANKLKEQRSVVGADLRAASEPIVTELVTEVMNKAWAKGN